MAKILYVHGGGEVIGGIEVWLAYCANFHRKYEVALAVASPGKAWTFLEKRWGNRGFLLPGGRLREVVKTVRAIWKAVKFIERHQVNWVVGCGSYSWLYAGMIGRLARVKTVFYVRNDLDPASLSRPIELLAHWIRPHLYLANSSFTAQSVQEHLSSPAVVNYPGANGVRFRNLDENQCRQKVVEEFGLSLEKTTFVLVGRLQAWKGQDLAVKAFLEMECREWAQLLIVGEVSFEEDRPHAREVYQLAEGVEGIVFAGRREDVPSLMKGADVVLHTSRSPEPFGVVVAEGMMAEKLVIASSGGGPEEMIESGWDGIIYEREHVGELARAMDWACRNPYEAKTMGSRAHIKSQSRFSVEASIRNIENLLEGWNLVRGGHWKRAGGVKRERSGTNGSITDHQ